MRRLLAPAVAAGLAAAMLTGCGGGDSGPEIEFRVPVFVQEVTTGSVEDRVVATGSLRAPESAILRAETGGALIVGRNGAGRRFAEGDRVRSGQMLAEITGEEVRINARTDATRQRYESAQRDHDSKKSLYDEGLLSEEAFRAVSTTLADAKVEWERSQLTESRSRLVTPIAGMILRLARDEDGLPMADGQLVTQGFVVAQVGPTANLIADVDLIGADVLQVTRGMECRVRHHAWEGEPFVGKVVRLAPTLDPMTRTLRAEVRVDNSGGRLRPGMFVEVTMISERRDDVPVVPREAVTERGGRKVVFVVKGQKVNRREVGLGLGDDDVVEIRTGLEPGERIVVRGLETLTDGTNVRVSGA